MWRVDLRTPMVFWHPTIQETPSSAKHNGLLVCVRRPGLFFLHGAFLLNTTLVFLLYLCFFDWKGVFSARGVFLLTASCFFTREVFFLTGFFGRGLWVFFFARFPNRPLNEFFLDP